MGQEIQFLPCEHDKRNGSYNWFALYNHGVIYKKGITYGSTRYDALVNKKFTIVGVDSIVDDNLYFREVKYCFRVTSPEFTDTMTLSLPVLHDPKHLGKLKSYSDFDQFSFRNLIILGYYEKLKQRLVNTTVTIKYSNNRYSDDEIILYDLSSGAPLTSTPKGKKLTIKDIGVIDGLEYGGLWYILSAPDFQDCFATLNPLQFSDAIPITKNQELQEQWERRMILRYGKVNGNLIIEGKVKIGFTKQMCIEAWGKPERINTSFGSWGSQEQWVYGLGTYLYFDGNRLTSIDN